MLKKIDFEKDEVNFVRLIKQDGDRIAKFIIDTNQIRIEQLVTYCEYEEFVFQDGRRWDWVKELICKVESQPIVLNITASEVKVIFGY